MDFFLYLINACVVSKGRCFAETTFWLSNAPMHNLQLNFFTSLCTLFNAVLLMEQRNKKSCGNFVNSDGVANVVATQM